MNIFNIDLLTIDYIILILAVVIIIFSLWKGFINSILGLLTWVGSVFITIFTYEYLSFYLNNLFLNINLLSNFEQFVSILSIIISIPIIFLLSLFILKRLRKIISSDLDKQIFGLILDKFFGAIYGLIFSYAICSAILFFTNNNSIERINNFNNFLITKSNILKLIDENNNSFIGLYQENE